jgi:hypothetical protein
MVNVAELATATNTRLRFYWGAGKGFNMAPEVAEQAAPKDAWLTLVAGINWQLERSLQELRRDHMPKEAIIGHIKANCMQIINDIEASDYD